MSKKLSSCVRPGVCEVRASVLRPVSALTRLDLPTLERPAKAISSPLHRRQVVDPARRPNEIGLAREQLAPGFDKGAEVLGHRARTLRPSAGGG